VVGWLDLVAVKLALKYLYLIIIERTCRRQPRALKRNGKGLPGLSKVSTYKGLGGF
jgi:hypothetical protein